MIGWICLPNILFGCNHMVLDNAFQILEVVRDLRDITNKTRLIFRSRVVNLKERLQSGDHFPLFTL